MKEVWIARQTFHPNGNTDRIIYKGQMFFCEKDELPMPSFKYEDEAWRFWSDYWERKHG